MWQKFSLLLLLLIACGKKNDPDEIFRRFLGEGLAGPSKEEMINLSTGKMKLYLEKMSDEDFKATLGKDISQEAKIKIKNRRCDQTKCVFTYSSSYESKENGQKTFDIESKKTAYLQKIDDQWKVEDIDTIKSYYLGREIK